MAARQHYDIMISDDTRLAAQLLHHVRGVGAHRHVTELHISFLLKFPCSLPVLLLHMLGCDTDEKVFHYTSLQHESPGSLPCSARGQHRLRSG